MSQHDYNIANGGGAAVRADINAALLAILSMNSGATAPTTTKPYMMWFDTANSLLKMRNAADTAWVTGPQVDASGNLGVSGNIAITASGNPSMTVKTTGAGNNPSYRLQANTNYWDFQGTFSNTDDELMLMYNGTARAAFKSGGQRQSTIIGGGGGIWDAFDCRAWVNFNGTGTVAIRGSGNVTSITDNGVGDYTANLTTAMPDANFGVVATSANTLTNPGDYHIAAASATTSTVNMRVYTTGTVAVDPVQVSIAVFR